MLIIYKISVLVINMKLVFGKDGNVQVIEKEMIVNKIMILVLDRICRKLQIYIFQIFKLSFVFIWIIECIGLIGYGFEFFISLVLIIIYWESFRDWEVSIISIVK